MCPKQFSYDFNEKGKKQNKQTILKSRKEIRGHEWTKKTCPRCHKENRINHQIKILILVIVNTC